MANDKFSIQFSTEISQRFFSLGKRRLMTPTFLSSLAIKGVILPAKSSEQELDKDSNGEFTDQSWINRSPFSQELLTEHPDIHQECIDTNKNYHTYTTYHLNGLETLQATSLADPKPTTYQVFFCGNGQDAIHLDTAYHRAQEYRQNYIFWNYPGVGTSVGKIYCKDDLIDAGYQQIKHLLDVKKIPANKITIYGLSLGGGVAAGVARKLHEEGHLVHLTIERSFSSLAATAAEGIASSLKSVGLEKNPFINSAITCALLGVALGTTFAGFISSVGLLPASTIAAIGYIGALFFRAIGGLLQALMTTIGKIIAFAVSFFSETSSETIKNLFDAIGNYLAAPFNYTAIGLNKIFSIIASLIDTTINLLASITGGIIAIGGLLGGALTGLVIGISLAIRNVWSDSPTLLPMKPIFSLILHSLGFGDLDSVNEIEELLTIDAGYDEAERPQITIINTEDDGVIVPDASLNTGLGFLPGPARKERGIHSIWYKRGGHTGSLTEEIVEGNNLEL